MKRIVCTIMAVAALAACTKSEVAYEAPAEITFAPAAKNITKAALTGTYPTTQKLGVYANYSNDVPSNAAVVANYSTKFLNNVLFSHNGTAWGAGEAWPSNGSLIFAGYAIPESGIPSGTYAYDFSTDELTITDYTQSNETANTFDLGWFHRTAASYNYRNSANTAVPVTLAHALAWIEIKVQGEGTTVAEGNPWTIKSMTLNNVYTTGDAVCKGSGVNAANWSNQENLKNMTIFNGTQALKTTATVCETTSAGTVVIPQTPTAVTPEDNTDTEVATLTVTYTYKSPAGVEMPLQTATVPLVVDGGWKSGYKYTYTLTFKASEILIAPKYDTWEDATGVPPVTVE